MRALRVQTSLHVFDARVSEQTRPTRGQADRSSKQDGMSTILPVLAGSLQLCAHAELVQVLRHGLSKGVLPRARRK